MEKGKRERRGKEIRRGKGGIEMRGEAGPFITCPAIASGSDANGGVRWGGGLMAASRYVNHVGASQGVTRAPPDEGGAGRLPSRREDFRCGEALRALFFFFLPFVFFSYSSHLSSFSSFFSPFRIFSLLFCLLY